MEGMGEGREEEVGWEDLRGLHAPEVLAGDGGGGGGWGVGSWRGGEEEGICEGFGAGGVAEGFCELESCEDGGGGDERASGVVDSDEEV